jgi:(4S)-4-hydroxy-5-phosphonooxypentane-2,3-dione isomerase
MYRGKDFIAGSIVFFSHSDRSSIRIPAPIEDCSPGTDTSSMLIVHVQIHVNSESVEDFIEATIENARNSIREPGIARFDVVQQTDDPTRFVLVEVYRDEAATKAHRETAHYAKWRDAVAPMMKEARTRTQFSNLFPEDGGW